MVVLLDISPDKAHKPIDIKTTFTNTTQNDRILKSGKTNCSYAMPPEYMSVFHETRESKIYKYSMLQKYMPVLDEAR